MRNFENTCENSRKELIKKFLEESFLQYLNDNLSVMPEHFEFFNLRTYKLYNELLENWNSLKKVVDNETLHLIDVSNGILKFDINIHFWGEKYGYGIEKKFIYYETIIGEDILKFCPLKIENIINWNEASIYYQIFDKGYVLKIWTYALPIALLGKIGVLTIEPETHWGTISIKNENSEFSRSWNYYESSSNFPKKNVIQFSITFESKRVWQIYDYLNLSFKFNIITGELSEINIAYDSWNYS